MYTEVSPTDAAYFRRYPLIRREVDMNEAAATWSTGRELVLVALAPHHLKRTLSVAMIVGTAFFAMNQLGVILAGDATVLVWLKAALTYLTPLLVSNFGLLSATRRGAVPTASPTRPQQKEGMTT
jgi:hypothetical protein